MRKIALLVAILACFTVSAWAGETARIPLLNGVYSVEVPVGWYVEQADDGSTTTISAVKGASASVMFTAPNPTVEGDIAGFAGTLMASLFKTMGGGQVTAEQEGDFNGYPNILFHFEIPVGDGMQGLANVIDIDGYGVLAIALAPSDELEAFWEKAAPIMESYEFDADAAEANEEVLDDLAEKLFEELQEILQ